MLTAKKASILSACIMHAFSAV